jgi:hypothetical protein
MVRLALGRILVGVEKLLIASVVVLTGCVYVLGLFMLGDVVHCDN